VVHENFASDKTYATCATLVIPLGVYAVNISSNEANLQTLISWMTLLD